MQNFIIGRGEMVENRVSLRLTLMPPIKSFLKHREFQLTGKK